MNYLVREFARVLEIFIGECHVVIIDHPQLRFEIIELHLLHAVLVALLDNCNDEVEEHDVASEHEHYVGQPPNDLVVGLLDFKGAFSPNYAKRHKDEAEGAEASTVGTWLLKQYLEDEAEGCHH